MMSIPITNQSMKLTLLVAFQNFSQTAFLLDTSFSLVFFELFPCAFPSVSPSTYPAPYEPLVLKRDCKY